MLKITFWKEKVIIHYSGSGDGTLFLFGFIALKGTAFTSRNLLHAIL